MITRVTIPGDTGIYVNGLRRHALGVVDIEGDFRGDFLNYGDQQLVWGGRLTVELIEDTPADVPFVPVTLAPAAEAPAPVVEEAAPVVAEAPAPVVEEAAPVVEEAPVVDAKPTKKK